MKKIAIIGFGVEGKALFDYLLKKGDIEITICDKNENLPLPDGAKGLLGEKYLEDLDKFDVIFRSPGIPYLLPEIQKVAKKVSSTTNYFIEHAKGRIVGVTGTKGKGTTSSLIYEMLKAAGEDVYLGGNIGKSPLSFLDELTDKSITVLELSSFQVQDLQIGPEVAVILNTTIDHLDYHKDVNEYHKAKMRMLEVQSAECRMQSVECRMQNAEFRVQSAECRGKNKGVCVLNEDYAYFGEFLSAVKTALATVSSKQAVNNGAWIEDDVFILNGESICDVNEMALVGRHNVENVMPAMVVADYFGVDKVKIAKVIRSFVNLEHRIEFVAEKNGVRYFNDSYSTNTQTCLAAIDSFAEPTAVIVGGFDKGLDYESFACELLKREQLVALLLIGATAEKILSFVSKLDHQFLVEDCETLDKAIERGREILEKKTPAVLVMSPAASSFDQFKSYKQRGEIFRTYVRNISES